VYEAMQEFFKTRSLDKQWNTTRLVLIPKVIFPSTAAEFRLISSYNVIYKGISMLICNKLKVVLLNLIDQS